MGIFLSLLTPVIIFAFTKSADFEATSNQRATAVDSASLSPTGDMTVEMWINIESLASNRKWLLDKLDGSGINDSYIFEIDGQSYSNAMAFSITGSPSSNVTDGHSAFNTFTSSDYGVWHHVAWVYVVSTKTMTMYLDGTATSTIYGSRNATNILDSTAGLKLASDYLGTGNFDGKIFNARIWTEARTGAQITNNWCVALGVTTNLSAEWSLDDVLTDNSGNENTLTNVNSFVFATDLPSQCAAAAATAPSQESDLILFE